MAKLRIREIAEARGYNMSRLQLDTRLNMSVVSRYWHNKVRNVSFDVLEKIGRVLRVPVSHLIDNEIPIEVLQKHPLSIAEDFTSSTVTIDNVDQIIPDHLMQDMKAEPQRSGEE